MKLKKIGFIGIGNMGFHMAYHLIKNKYDVYPYDKINKNLEIFQNKYLKKKNNFLSYINELDCVILMVPSSKEVNEIMPVIDHRLMSACSNTCRNALKCKQAV